MAEKFIVSKGKGDQKFHYFRMTIPEAIRSKFENKTKVMVALGDSMTEARKQRDRLRDEWHEKFRRAKLDDAEALQEEIASAGRKSYLDELENLKFVLEVAGFSTGVPSLDPKTGDVVVTYEKDYLDKCLAKFDKALSKESALDLSRWDFVERELIPLAKHHKFDIDADSGWGNERDIEIKNSFAMSIVRGKRKAVVEMLRKVRGHEHAPADLEPVPPAKPAKSSVPTFGECAKAFIEIVEKRSGPGKHFDQVKMHLTKYAAPLHEYPVDQITTPLVLSILRPLFTANEKNPKPRIEAASRLRGNIEAILDIAKEEGHRSGDNPAAKSAMRKSWPQKPDPEHQVALPYREIPAFMRALSGQAGISAKVAMFTILTASRPGEARGATWEEVDLAGRRWAIPAERYKTRESHCVPLSKQAIALLEALPGERKGLVFPNPRSGKCLSENAMRELILDMDIKTIPQGKKEPELITAHGTARSGFADWAVECAKIGEELADRCLGHKRKGKPQQAYFRTDELENRVPVMQQWADFCLPA